MNNPSVPGSLPALPLVGSRLEIPGGPHSKKKEERIKEKVLRATGFFSYLSN